MTEPSPTESAPPPAAPRPAQADADPPRRADRARRLVGGLLRLAVVAALLGAVGTTTVYALERVGFTTYSDPFVLYNRNRIDAAAFHAQQTPDSTLVVALGTSRLRMATLDEGEMARMAAAEGLPPFHFLRISANAAEFADFEPLLDRIIASQPDLVLLDMDLLFRERRPLAFAKERLRAVADTLVGGPPFALDQVRQQYAKTCAPPAAGGVAAFVDDQDWRFALAADSPAYQRARAFAERAAAAGVAVAVLEMRRPPAVEQSRFGGAPYLPEATARLAADGAFDVWRFPARLQRDASYCNFMHLGDEARAAYSEWLVATIAGSTGAPAIEAVSMR
ncbi:hypothetical protein [Azospirillum sp. ST 5-10]|uniref:hypothetical protein n=1 Tax=unclassified Azospirillum TaxID=2630922 RepID=UPI003F49DBEF